MINDGVMGGRSRSEILLEAGRAVFAGTVSPENNGGFASIRTTLTGSVAADAGGFKLRVRGDGRTYQYRVRTDVELDGAAYKQEFRTTPGLWLDVALPMAGFVATFRGRPVPGAPPLIAAEIRQIGFLIAGGQYGAFRLEVERIEVMV